MTIPRHRQRLAQESRVWRRAGHLGHARGWDVAEARGLVLQRVLLPAPMHADRFLYPDLPHDELGRVDTAALQPLGGGGLAVKGLLDGQGDME